MSHPEGHFLEDLAVGMSATITKTVTDDDVTKFAEVSCDTNPVHLDEDFAAASPFKTRIAHGMLSGALISAVLGTKLPGPGTIYLSQTLKFKAPVRIGDAVQATATVVEIDISRKRVRLDCSCVVGETLVVDGEAIVMVPSKSQAG